MCNTKLIRLNLGCGNNKIDGFINIDIERSCEPDVVLDFIREKLPYESNSVDEVVMFHTIEHICKRFHSQILEEIWRVLKLDGMFLVSFPEFSKCYRNWEMNYKGKREFWEATLYGRQLYPSDYHVCIMDSIEFSDALRNAGFSNIFSTVEPQEEYNSVISCVKGIQKLIKYEDLLAQDMGDWIFSKVIE